MVFMTSKGTTIANDLFIITFKAFVVRNITTNSSWLLLEILEID